MSNRLQTRRFRFTVEGDTELWYLNWLAREINRQNSRKMNVDISVSKKRPVEYVKSLTSLYRETITHFQDIESQEDEHRRGWIHLLDELAIARKLKTGIAYRLGYSNYTFDLWMVLHKKDCFGHLTNRNQYLPHINVAYGVHFDSMRQYKREDNFHHVLSQLSIADVYSAIQRAETIMEQNANAGYQEEQYKRYRYYRENPSLSLHAAIKGILSEVLD